MASNRQDSITHLHNGRPEVNSLWAHGRVEELAEARFITLRCLRSLRSCRLRPSLGKSVHILAKCWLTEAVLRSTQANPHRRRHCACNFRTSGEESAVRAVAVVVIVVESEVRYCALRDSRALDLRCRSCKAKSGEVKGGVQSNFSSADKLHTASTQLKTTLHLRLLHSRLHSVCWLYVLFRSPLAIR